MSRVNMASKISRISPFLHVGTILHCFSGGTHGFPSFHKIYERVNKHVDNFTSALGDNHFGDAE